MSRPWLLSQVKDPAYVRSPGGVLIPQPPLGVRFNASTEYAVRTASLPDQYAFTICGFGVQDVDTNTYTTLCSIENAASNSGYYYLLSTNADGQSLKCWNVAGEGSTFATLAVGVPFFWAMTSEVRGYYRTLDAAAFSTAAVSQSSAFTSGVQAMFIGNDSFGEPFDGRIWGVRVWDRVLTEAELTLEFQRVLPVNRQQLHLAWPMNSANLTVAFRDISGNKRDATQGGTLSIERAAARAPIDLQRIRRRKVSAASGGTDGTINGATIVNTISLLAGAFEYSTQFAGGTLTNTVSLIAGALQASSTIAGQTITNTVSIIPGALSGSSTAPGVTLTNTVSLIPGSMTGDSTATGSTITNTVSLIAGALAAAAVIAGGTLTNTVSLIPGAFSGDSTMAGATITNTISLIPGSIGTSGDATIAGQTLVNTVSLIPGALANDSTMAGATVVNTVSISAGALQASSTIAGQIITNTLSILAGAMSNSSTMAGATIVNTITLLPGTVYEPGGAAALVPTKPIGIDIGIRV